MSNLIALSNIVLLVLHILASADGKHSSMLALYWCPVSAGLPSDINAMAMTPDALYAGTWGQGIYKSTNYGESWIEANTGITLPLYLKGDALTTTPLTPTLLFAGDYYGAGLYRSANAGLSWTISFPDAAISAVVVDPISPTIVYLGERNDGIYKSTNAGTTWFTATNGLASLHVSTLAVDPVTPTTIYAGVEEHLFKTTNAGLTWTLAGAGLPSTSTIQSLLVHPATPTIVLAGTRSAGVWLSTDAGDHFTGTQSDVLSKTWITDLAIDPAGTLYAAAWSGEVYRSPDLGATWEGLGYLGYVYALEAHPQIPGAIYAGTSNNGLFRGTVLGGFDFAPVDSPQVAGYSFSLILTATDVLGFPLTPPEEGFLCAVAAEDQALAETLAHSFEGPVTLTDTTGTITPTVVTFTLGVATPRVIIDAVMEGVVITATAAGAGGSSNPFDVIVPWRVFLPLVGRGAGD